MVHHEDSYVSDAAILEGYVQALHAESSTRRSSSSPASARNSLGFEVMETELITRWRGVIASLPRSAAHGHCAFSERQLEYIGMLVKQVLAARDSTVEVLYMYR